MLREAPGQRVHRGGTETPDLAIVNVREISANPCSNNVKTSKCEPIIKLVGI